MFESDPGSLFLWIRNTHSSQIDAGKIEVQIIVITQVLEVQQD